MAHILIVDDEDKMRHLLALIMEGAGHKVDAARDGLEALERIQTTPFDMVVTDIKMPRMDGFGLLEEIMALAIPCPVVFITAFATVDSAVEAMRKGAADYITKPFEEDRILLTITRTLNLSRIMAENVNLKEEIRKLSGPIEIVYQSRAMTEVMELAARVAKTDTAVMLSGESGTGKELMARFIHLRSARRKNRFVPVNCAAISPALVESELFGYEKGAFTGANKRTQGKFEFASQGTLFLDEVGELPLDAQAKLLRALQDKKIQRVGGHEEIKADARVVCATNRDLETLVAQQKFRQDLFFRINVFPITMPPLRERKEDILPLTDHFLKSMAGKLDIGISEGAVRILTEYSWPGNVRELSNAIERAVILSMDNGAITADMLSFLKFNYGNVCDQSPFTLPPEGIQLQEVEMDLVRQALEYTSDNQTLAANLLGLTRSKFRVLMKKVIKDKRA